MFYVICSICNYSLYVNAVPGCKPPGLEPLKIHAQHYTITDERRGNPRPKLMLYWLAGQGYGSISKDSTSCGTRVWIHFWRGTRDPLCRLKFCLTSGIDDQAPRLNKICNSHLTSVDLWICGEFKILSVGLLDTL